MKYIELALPTYRVAKQHIDFLLPVRASSSGTLTVGASFFLSIELKSALVREVIKYGATNFKKIRNFNAQSALICKNKNFFNFFKKMCNQMAMFSVYYGERAKKGA